MHNTIYIVLPFADKWWHIVLLLISIVILIIGVVLWIIALVVAIVPLNGSKWEYHDIGFTIAPSHTTNLCTPYGRKFSRFGVEQTNCQIKIHPILSKISNWSLKYLGTRHQSVHIVNQSQGKCKLVSSGVDYGVIQLFIFVQMCP